MGRQLEVNNVTKIIVIKSQSVLASIIIDIPLRLGISMSASKVSIGRPKLMGSK